MLMLRGLKKRDCHPKHQCATPSKICNVCGIEKSIKEFYAHRDKCKKCFNAKIYKPKKKAKKLKGENIKKCLGCGEEFVSKGIFNRVCWTCKKVQRNQNTYEPVIYTTNLARR